MENDNLIVGMTLEQAQEHLKPLGLRVRATTVDGKACLCTRDYRTDRLNVAIVAGKISSVGSRG